MEENEESGKNKFTPNIPDKINSEVVLRGKGRWWNVLTLTMKFL